MGIKFTDELIIGGGDWELAPFRFSKILKIGGGGSSPTYEDIVISGSGSVTLSNAKANGLNYVKLFGACEQTDALPNEYTQLDSITLGNNCYFNTGIVINSLDAYVKLIAKFDTPPDTNPHMMWGFMGSSSNLPRWGVGSYANKWLTSPNATGQVGTRDTALHVFETLLYNNNGAPYYKTFIDNELMVNASWASTETMTANTLPIYIGARNNNGTATNFGLGDFTYLEVIQRGICVARIYACKRNSDNTLGLYNTITNEFLTNLGTGTVTAGSTTITPSPYMSIPIKCNNGALKVSSNLLDMADSNIVVGKYINNNGVETSHDSNFYNNKFIPVSASTTYTWSTSTSINYINFMEYDATKTFIKRTLIGATGQPAGTSGQFTIGDNTAYVLIGANPFTNTLTLEQIKAVNWQFEVGSTATAYRPYGEIYTDGTVETVRDSLNNTATAEMLLSLLTKGGDFIYAQDTQNVTTGEVTRNVGIKVFDGTETWNRGSNQDASGNYVFYMSLTDRKIQDSAQGLLCSHFKFRGTVSYSTMLQDEFCINQTIQYIYFDGAGYTTVDAFKAYLVQQYANGTPVIVVYPLATSTTETVTAQHLSTKSGDNTIEITQASINNLPLEVSYKGTIEGE